MPGPQPGDSDSTGLGVELGIWVLLSPQVALVGSREREPLCKAWAPAQGASDHTLPTDITSPLSYEDR